MKTAGPIKPKLNLSKIYNDINILVLTLHISYAITQRKTAHMISNITKNPDITLFTDSKPSYMAALHFVNVQIKTLKKVIGLKNLDAQSEEFRAFKQIIERLNRTFKYHIQDQNGFNSVNANSSFSSLTTTS